MDTPLKSLFPTRMAPRVRAVEQHTTGRESSIHRIHLSRRREDGVIVQERYWRTFGMTKDPDFVHPRVKIEVWQAPFPRIAFEPETGKEIAQNASRWWYSKKREREQRTKERQDAYIAVNQDLERRLEAKRAEEERIQC